MTRSWTFHNFKFEIINLRQRRHKAALLWDHPGGEWQLTGYYHAHGFRISWVKDRKR